MTSSTIDKKLENFEFIFEFKIALNLNFNFGLISRFFVINFEFIFEFFVNFDFLSMADEATITVFDTEEK